MSERFSKRDADRAMGPDDKFDDGTTPSQRANMRAIYEDSPAYAEWRIRMGLNKPLGFAPSAEMRQRRAALAKQIAAGLQEPSGPRRRDPWEPEAARQLSPEELAALYAANPVKLSVAALERS